MNAQSNPQNPAAVIAVVELSDEEKAAIETARAARIQRLDQIGFSLEGWRDEAIRYRLEYEQEWVEAHNQYDEGEIIDGNLRGTREYPATNDLPDYRKTRDNITRPAVLMVTSRVADMLFPTSDRNWDLTPSPDAEVPPELLDIEIQKILDQRQKDGPPPPQPATEEGAPPTPTPDTVPNKASPAELTYDERQTLEQKVAEERCNRMRTRIDDQLQESSYAAHGRDTIADSALYGTGVIKGPFAKRRNARVYRNGRWIREWTPTPTPAATYVDLFNFYPRPCRRISECPGVFELHLLTAERMRALVNQPGFDRNQIARVLKEEGRTPGALAQSVIYRLGITSRSGVIASLLDNRYATWEYHGSLPKQGVVDFIGGLLEQDKVSADAAAAIIAEVEADPMTEMMCECWMVNGIVIKLAIAQVPSVPCIYHVYNYEERPDTLFGKGVPRVMRDDQMATTQLWQAMMLNAMMSAGLQIGVKKGSLEPMGAQGGKHDLTTGRPRVWAFNDETDDIRKAFSAFEVPSVIDSLMPLYERSKKNSEEHIVLPSIVQGDPTNSVQTSSGLAMLMNAGNIVTRRLAKGWDDNITTPLIGGFFEYNMDHGPDDIKGDYMVVPRGSSHLLVKDVQSQRFLFALQIYAANPKLERQMKWEEWGRQGLVVMDLDANRLLYSADDLKRQDAAAAANPPPPGPDELLAQARVAESQARTNAAEANIQLANLKLEQQKQESTDDIAFRREELAAKMRIAELNYFAKLAELDQNTQNFLEDLRAKAESDGLWARLEAGALAQKERRDAIEIAVESPDPRLA